MKMKILFFIMLLLSVFIFVSCTDKQINKEELPKPTMAVESVEDLTDQVETTVSPDTNKENERIVINHNNMKAMWLSQFDLQNIYTDTGKQREKNDFSARIDVVLENVQKNGFNTVFLQIRPYADSFYPSTIYPPSKYVTGSYNNDFLYDPIPIIIEKAHNLNLSIHAWINPLRGMTTDEIKSVNDNYVIKQWYNQSKNTYLVSFNDRYYLNPAYPETRRLILQGVDEILANYQFDGLHMDDYFYPTTDESFDSSAYSDYCSNGGTLSLKQYRAENISALVREMYSAVKKTDPDLLYGISPEGNINNATEKSYADVYKWCSNEGYIDYICPQIYFGLEHQTWAFDKTANIWANIIKTEKVDLIIGMTFGKALSKTDKWAGSGKDEWTNHNDVMKRCLEYTKTIEKCDGISVFCYQYYYDPLSAIEVSETKTEREGFTKVLKNIEW